VINVAKQESSLLEIFSQKENPHEREKECNQASSRHEENSDEKGYQIR
jgi:hypothetical protein